MNNEELDCIMKIANKRCTGKCDSCEYKEECDKEVERFGLLDMYWRTDGELPTIVYGGNVSYPCIVDTGHSYEIAVYHENIGWRKIHYGMMEKIDSKVYRWAYV
jgi:hypothetical protein